MAKEEQNVRMADDNVTALEFLLDASDAELKWFLRRLPVFIGSEDGQVTLKDLIYEMRLVPFVMDAWLETKGNPGIPGRLQQLSRVYKIAEAEMEKMTGERRRLPRLIDIPSFTQVYATVGLP